MFDEGEEDSCGGGGGGGPPLRRAVAGQRGVVMGRCLKTVRILERALKTPEKSSDPPKNGGLGYAGVQPHTVSGLCGVCIFFRGGVPLRIGSAERPFVLEGFRV